MEIHEDICHFCSQKTRVLSSEKNFVKIIKKVLSNEVLNYTEYSRIRSKIKTCLLCAHKLLLVEKTRLKIENATANKPVNCFLCNDDQHLAQIQDWQDLNNLLDSLDCKGKKKKFKLCLECFYFLKSIDDLKNNLFKHYPILQVKKKPSRPASRKTAKPLSLKSPPKIVLSPKDKLYINKNLTHLEPLNQYSDSIKINRTDDVKLFSQIPIILLRRDDLGKLVEESKRQWNLIESETGGPSLPNKVAKLRLRRATKFSEAPIVLSDDSDNEQTEKLKKKVKNLEELTDAEKVLLVKLQPLKFNEDGSPIVKKKRKSVTFNDENLVEYFPTNDGFSEEAGLPPKQNNKKIVYPKEKIVTEMLVSDDEESQENTVMINEIIDKINDEPEERLNGVNENPDSQVNGNLEESAPTSEPTNEEVEQKVDAPISDDKSPESERISDEIGEKESSDESEINEDNAMNRKRRRRTNSVEDKLDAKRKRQSINEITMKYTNKKLFDDSGNEEQIGLNDMDNVETTEASDNIDTTENVESSEENEATESKDTGDNNETLENNEIIENNETSENSESSENNCRTETVDNILATNIDSPSIIDVDQGLNEIVDHIAKECISPNSKVVVLHQSIFNTVPVDTTPPMLDNVDTDSTSNSQDTEYESNNEMTSDENTIVKESEFNKERPICWESAI